MDVLHHLFWYDEKFLGITWGVWKVIGWLGNAIFSTRFFVQWYATEKKKQVIVPPLFWWLSVLGSLLLLVYGLFFVKDSVYIFAYAFNWIPYIRNLVIHYRHEKSRLICPECGAKAPAAANFCSQCGLRLVGATEPASEPR